MNGYEWIGLTLMIISASSLSKHELGLIFRVACIFTFYFGFRIAYNNRSNSDDSLIKRVY